MKNTNKLLSLGVALAIALCASVQVSAMYDTGRPVNPKLSAKNREFLEKRIRYMQSEIEALQERGNVDVIPKLRNRLNRSLAMYHGNYPYTEKEIRDTDKIQ